MDPDHRALSDLVGGRSVLDGRVAGIVLVLVGYTMSARDLFDAI